MIDYLVGLSTLTGINVLLVLGLAVLTPFAGYISISSGAVAGVGAYTYGILTTKFALAPILAAAAGVGACAVLGLVVAEAVSRLKGEIHLLATLALQLVVVETLRRWKTLTGGDGGLPGIPPLAADLTPNALAAIVAGLVIAIGVSLHLWLTGAHGLRLRAIRDDVEVAQASGCNVRKETRIAFVLSAAIVGGGGVLVAMHHAFLQPETFGLGWSISILLMVMLGGANILGCVLSAIFLSMLPELIYLAFPVRGMQVGAMQNIVYGLVLLALMLFMPRGVFPETRLRRRLPTSVPKPPVSQAT